MYMKVTVVPIARSELESCLSRAEIFYKQGKVVRALASAQAALLHCKREEQRVALNIFIAKCLSRLGRFDESNAVYRSLIDDKVYLPPVIMGLMHNNLQLKKDDKVSKNMHLIKLFV